MGLFYSFDANFSYRFYRSGNSSTFLLYSTGNVFWDKPLGRKAFGLSKEFATQSKAMAANQGLYNGFLAAGLIWGLSLGIVSESGHPIVIFFLACVIVAGIFGGFTVSKKIIVIQALPALIALVFTLFL